MKILAIETSTDACSLALLVNDTIRSHHKIAAKHHGKLALPLIQSLLADAELSLTQLSAIALGNGPGSFTGLRIAAGIAQGLAFAADLPIIPISSIETLAHSIHREHQYTRLLIAQNAYQNEIYWNEWRYDAPYQTTTLCSADNAPLPQDKSIPWIAVGDGWQVYQSILATRFSNYIDQTLITAYPNAYDLAQLAKTAFNQGKTIAPEAIEPCYLRSKNAWRTST